MLSIANPFIDEIGRNTLNIHTEKVVHLGRKNGERNTRRETYDNRIWNKLDDITQFEYTHEDEQYTRHDRGDEQAREAMLLDDTIDNDDEGAGRTTNLHLATTKSRDDEAGNDSRDESFGRTYARCDTKSDSQRNSDDTNDPAR